MKGLLRIITIINIVLVICTLAAYLGSYINPQRISFLQVFGLFMPWMLLINGFLALFWLTMRKRQFWLSFLTLLVGVPQVSRFVGLHFNQLTGPEHLMITTFNCESYNESDNLKIFLQNLEQKDAIDILCLQEISPDQVGVLTEGIGLAHHYFYKGKIVASRFPIKDKGHIQFDKSVNGCLWTDLSIGEGKTIRVYNVHLRSNGVTHAAEGLIDEINVDRRAAFSRFKGMVSNYQDASKTRAQQVREIIGHLNTCQLPVVLMGDLNDTPFSYTYQQLANHLQDQFKCKGLGVGITYGGDIPGLKIDYIFADENFEALSYQTLRTKISDHFPVVSRMKLNM